MLVILGACGVLVALAAGFYLTRYTDRGPEFMLQRTQAELVMTGRALEGFKAEQGRYPTLEEDLQPSYARKKARDGWGKDLVYRLRVGDQVRAFDLYSIGPNGIDEQGRGDDVDFWSVEVQHWYAQARVGNENKPRP